MDVAPAAGNRKETIDALLRGQQALLDRVQALEAGNAGDTHPANLSPVPQAPTGADAPLVEADAGGGRSAGSCLDKAKFVAELLLLTMLLYYADLVLDILSLKQMWDTGNPRLCFLNLGGILMASLLGYVLMVRKIKSGIHESKESLWVAGSLYFSQLHVLYLGWHSLLRGQVHPLLYEAKFVESTVESVVSASVQVYFLVWERLPWEKKKWILISIATSFCTLAFGNAGFDLQDRGIARVRGSATKMTSGKFLKVFVFRLCEIVARITSLALFQRACRPYGAVTVIGVDFLVMLLLTWYHGGNLAFAVPSVFAYMNPMLEVSNAVSMPCGIYFGVRFMELAAMAGTAFIWRGHKLLGLYDEDQEVVIGLACGLVGMALFLPCARHKAMPTLLAYPPEFWHAAPFSEAEVKLLKDLLNRPAEIYVTEEMHVTIDVAPGPRTSLLRNSPSYFALEAVPEARLTEPLRSRLPPNFDFSGADMMSEAAKILVLAQNCPVWVAGDSLKVTLVEFLRQLADPKEMVQRGKPSMHREVLDGGGVDVALMLAEDPAASYELQESALRLAVLALKNVPAEASNLTLLVDRAKKLAEMVCSEQGKERDATMVSATAQAAVAAEEFGCDPNDVLFWGPRAAGGVLYASAAGTLKQELQEESVRKVLKDYGGETFPWGDPHTDSGRKVGGLCISQLLERKRRGEPIELTFEKKTDAYRWTLQLRTPAEKVKDVLEALQKSFMDYNAQRVLAQLGTLVRSDPEAAVEAGCNEALQAFFLRSSSSRSRTLTMTLLSNLNLLASGIGGFSGPVYAKLAQSYTQSFFDGVKNVIQSCADSKQLPSGDVASASVAFVMNLACYMPLHAQLLPLAPALASLTETTGCLQALQTIYNVALAPSSRLRLQKIPAVSEVLQKVATGQIIVKSLPQLDLDDIDDVPAFGRYQALHALCLLRADGDSSHKSIITQPENLKLLLANLKQWPTGWAPFEAVMPLPMLAALPEAHDALREQGIVGLLRSFCLKVGLEGVDEEKAVGIAFEALTILLADPAFAEGVTWEDDDGRSFKDLVKAAMDRPQLRAEAQILEWHCCSGMTPPPLPAPTPAAAPAASDSQPKVEEAAPKDESAAAEEAAAEDEDIEELLEELLADGGDDEEEESEEAEDEDEEEPLVATGEPSPGGAEGTAAASGT